MKTLQEAFAEPLDFDGAEFELAKCLGLMPDIPWDPALKSLFWTNNQFSVPLYTIIEALVEMGALRMNEERQFLWNVTFTYDIAAAVTKDAY